jgi:hypothetical protein
MRRSIRSLGSFSRSARRLYSATIRATSDSKPVVRQNSIRFIAVDIRGRARHDRSVLEKIVLTVRALALACRSHWELGPETWRGSVRGHR